MNLKSDFKRNLTRTSQILRVYCPISINFDTHKEKKKSSTSGKMLHLDLPIALVSLLLINQQVVLLSFQGKQAVSI